MARSVIHNALHSSSSITYSCWRLRLHNSLRGALAKATHVVLANMCVKLRVCMCACACVCVRKSVCVSAYVCVCVCVCQMCVCVPCESVFAFVRACIRKVSRARRFFTRMRMHLRTWAEVGKVNYV